MDRKSRQSPATKDAAARAQRYRDRADYLRGMAKRAEDAQVRQELQRIARECEARALRNVSADVAD